MTPRSKPFDPRLDLKVEREVRASAETAWAAWTRPEHIRQWYAPAPGVIAECEIDLRPGGIFRFVPRQPDGTEHVVTCCYLEVDPFRRLVWTDALLPGYRPATTPFFTALMTLEPRGDLTLCTTVAMHGSEGNRDLHDAMGFHDGWGTVLDQLVAFAPGI
ncbi:MAG: polyketide cyclase [Actinomycetia bacterium]|nr:polyketide cyclase [Actinomycetes bacterium]